MPREHEVTESIVIAASPMAVYEAVSNPANMGRWSPENKGARLPEAGPAYVGMHFVGRNKRGPMRWSTRCTVTAAEPGRRFAFDVDRYGMGVPIIPIRIASWAYDIEPVSEGTRVTETWIDGRDWLPDGPTRVFDWLATGRRTFATMNRRNMQVTLRRLKAELEA